MDDLISRAAAIRALGECPYNWNDWPEEIQAVDDWEYYKEAIENIPAVDAVQVVRCRDCKHSIENAKHIDVACERSYDPDFYCAAGERKDSK